MDLISFANLDPAGMFCMFFVFRKVRYSFPGLPTCS